MRGARTFLSASACCATPKRTGMSALQTNARRARTKLSACHGAGGLLETLRQGWNKTWARGELLRAYRGEIGWDARSESGAVAIAVHASAGCLLMKSPDSQCAPPPCMDAFHRWLERGRWFRTPCLGWNEFVPHYVSPLRPGKDVCDAENGQSRAQISPRQRRHFRVQRFDRCGKRVSCPV